MELGQLIDVVKELVEESRTEFINGEFKVAQEKLRESAELIEVNLGDEDAVVEEPTETKETPAVFGQDEQASADAASG
jgi:hypothetical protein